MKTILLLARDPGGANTIFPLVEPLRAKGYKIKLFGKDTALEIYEKFGFYAEDIVEYMETLDIRHCKDFLRLQEPDFIITGTSGDDFTERYMWAAADELGIPSLAIIDQWMNSGIRFSAYSGYEQDKYWQSPQAKYLPLRILAIDAELKQQLINEGIPADKILISGHPYFQVIDTYRKSIKTDEIFKSRQELGLVNEFMISFISEPISQHYPPDSNSYWGYDEKTILAQLLNSLEKSIPYIEKEIHLFIKPHPRENMENYNWITTRSKSAIKLKLIEDYDNWKLLQASDLVCGMSSMLLLEAVLLRKPVLSIQIGLQREDPFVLSSRKIMPSILEEDQLSRQLKPIIQDNSSQLIDWHIDLNATQNIISIMEEYI